MSCYRHNCLIHRGPTSFPMASANNSWRRQKSWGGTSESCPKPIHVFLTWHPLLPGRIPAPHCSLPSPSVQDSMPSSCSGNLLLRLPHSSPEPSPPSACSLPPTEGCLETHLLPTCHSAAAGAINVLILKAKLFPVLVMAPCQGEQWLGTPFLFQGPCPRPLEILLFSHYTGGRN